MSRSGQQGRRSSRAGTLASLLSRLDVHRRLAEHHGPLGTADARLLWLLSDSEPRTLKQIGTDLHLEQSTVNRQVNGAVAAGLVRRVERAGEGTRRFAPTDDGSAAFKATIETALGAYEAALAGLGDDADEFLARLTTFVDAYGEAVQEP